LSAKGAEYDSQGQAPNNVRRVAPGYRGIILNRALKVRNINVNFALSELHRYWRTLSRGDAPYVVRRLPLALIFRAFGAGNRLFVQSR